MLVEMPFARRPIALVALIAMLGSLWLFLFRVHEILAYTMDDSFITYRYALHAARGQGITWNVGENPPAEGYTSFLWLAILSFAIRLQADVETTAKLLGIASVIMTASLIFIAVLRSAKLPAACLGVALFLSNAHLPAHAVCGMETSAALLLMTALCFVAAEYLRRPRALTACGAGITALLLGLMRPEMNLAAGVALTLVLILTSKRTTFVLYGLIPWLIGGAGYFFWRWSYFGLPFPLPFYVKQMGHGLFPGFRPTAAYVIFLWPLYPVLALFTLRLLRAHREWIPALGGIAAIVFYLIFPAHIMGVDYRFVFPTYGAVAVFAGLGVGDLLRGEAWPHPRRSTVLVGLALIFAVFMVQQRARYRMVRFTTTTDARGLSAAHIPLGKTLAALDPDGRHLLAISDAGAVPFYSGWRTIDTFGLNNREIALGLASGYDTGFVLSSRPDILVLISNRQEEFDPPLAFEGLLYTACRTQGYRRLGTLAYSDEYYLWLMVREAGMADAVRAALTGRVAAFAE
jgi:hypothetical protein